MKEITLDTKILDLLNDYDDMKDILIDINPKFKKLNNPVLRRTLGRVAGVRQAAIVGGMDPMDLLNRLRLAVGQESTCEECPIKSDDCLMPIAKPEPSWINGNPTQTLDANEILDKDQNPLAIARKELKGLLDGEFIALIADFRPEPLIDEFIKAGYHVYTVQKSETEFVTYVQKANES